MKDKGIWLAGIGGGIGACLRYVVAIVIPTSTFPVATLLVNLIGCFLLAFWTASFFKTEKNIHLKYLLGTGVCGGFTTMSTFTYETISLVQDLPLIGILYVSVSVFGSLGMALLGFKKGEVK